MDSAFTIIPGDYAELARLAWNRDPSRPITGEEALGLYEQKWAEVSVRFPALRDGDKAIAATAMSKGHGVATRNLGDFRQAGLVLVNPFDPGTWDDGWDDDPLSTLLDG